MYSKKTKALAIIASVIILFVTVFSFFYIAKEANHDCSGQDCQICYSIQNAENIIQKIGTGSVFTLLALMIFAFRDEFKAIVIDIFAFAHLSLINRKVRLNN